MNYVTNSDPPQGFYNSSIRRYRDRHSKTSSSSPSSKPPGESVVVMASNNNKAVTNASGHATTKELAKANAKRRRMEDHLGSMWEAQ